MLTDSDSIQSHTHEDDLGFGECLDTFATHRPTLDFGRQANLVTSVLVKFNSHLTIGSDRFPVTILFGVRDQKLKIDRLSNC